MASARTEAELFVAAEATTFVSAVVVDDWWSPRFPLSSRQWDHVVGMLAELDGSCRTPIAGHAVIMSDGTLHLRGLIVKPDGSELIATERRGAVRDADAMGRDAGRELKRRGGPGFLST